MGFADVEDAFHTLLPLPPAERARRLAALAPEVASEVRALLDADAGAGFLDAPVCLGILDRPPTPADAPAAVAADGELDGFRLVRSLGSGAMGEVFEAWQDAPRRRVALKVLRARQDPAALRRFAAEAETLGRLDHPHIARVFASGVAARSAAGGVPWIAMELVVDPLPITAHAVAAGLDRRARVALFRPVLDAVHHAHRRGVLHRDLKPANVLVAGDGEGGPRVIDFGIARSRDALPADAVERTRAGELLGSLPWMSPEQARGDPDAVDVRSDVYALGAILHELCCGALPNDLAGLGLLAALQRIRDARPVDPRRADPTLDADLAAVIARALHPDPDARYDSAAALAADLDAWLGHRPVRARRAHVLDRVRLFARRRRAAFVALLATALLVVTATAAIAGLWLEARAARRAAAEQREAAHAAVVELAALRRRVEARLRNGAAPSRVAPMLVESYRQQVADAGSDAERRRLVEESVWALERIAGDLDADPAGLDLLAASYEDVARLIDMPWAADPADAAIRAAALERALAIRDRLGGPTATATADRDAWYDAAIDFVHSCRGAGEPARAAAIADAAVALARADWELAPDDRDRGVRYIQALWARGDLHIDHPPPSVGREDSETARQVGAALLAAHPDATELLDIHAWTLFRLGIWTATLAHDAAAAVEVHLEALDLRQRWCALAPTDPDRALALVAHTVHVWHLLAATGRGGEIRPRLDGLLAGIEPARTPAGRARLAAAELRALGTALPSLPAADRDWCRARAAAVVAELPIDRVDSVDDLPAAAGWLQGMGLDTAPGATALLGAALAILEGRDDLDPNLTALRDRLRESCRD